MVLEEKKKKKPYSSITYTTGDIQKNIDFFNRMLTGKAKNTKTSGLPGAWATANAKEEADKVGTIAAVTPDGGNALFSDSIGSSEGSNGDGATGASGDGGSAGSATEAIEKEEDEETFELYEWLLND